MGGKHAAPPQEHTRRALLAATPALGLAIVGVAFMTGDQPRVEPITEPIAQPVAPKWPEPMPSEFDELVNPPAPRAATTRREALGREAEARTSRAAARRATRPEGKAKDRARPKAPADRRADPKAASAIIATSRKYFGIRYRWGGKNPATGLDCSGYTKLVYEQHGINLPHGSRAQARHGVQVSQPRPGDLLFVKNALGIVHHVAIYVGGGYMHDAPRTGLTVGRRRVWSKPSRTFYRRVL